MFWLVLIEACFSGLIGNECVKLNESLLQSNDNAWKEHRSTFYTLQYCSIYFTFHKLQPEMDNYN